MVAVGRRVVVIMTSPVVEFEPRNPDGVVIEIMRSSRHSARVETSGESPPSMEPKIAENEEIAAAFRQTRRSLIERLHNWEDQRTWDDFYQTYWKLIFSVALKSGLRREEAFDVVQETIISIAKQSKKNLFDPDKGSFKSWLLNAARWRIADQFRKRAKDTATAGFPSDDPGGSNDALERVADPGGDALERIWDNEWKSHVSEIAVDRVKSRVSPKQFQIFHCHVVQGWGVRKVSEALGVNSAQVYLAKHRVGSQVKKEIAALENKFI